MEKTIRPLLALNPPHTQPARLGVFLAIFTNSVHLAYLCALGLSSPKTLATNAPRSPPLRCLEEAGKFFSGTLCGVQGGRMCQPAGVRHPQQVPCKPAPVPAHLRCRRTPDMCPLILSDTQKRTLGPRQAPPRGERLGDPGGRRQVNPEAGLRSFP